MGAQFGVSDSDWKTIDEECGPGERVLWVGRPRPLRVLLRDTSALTNLGIALAGAIVMLVIFNNFYSDLSFTTSGADRPAFSFTFGSILTLVVVGGLIFVTAPFVITYLQATQMVYAITASRAMIVTRPALWWGQSVQSFSPNDLTEITRTTLADGSGDVIFSAEEYSYRTRYGRRTRTRKIGFWGVPNVIEVEQLLLSTFKQRAE